MNNKFETLYQNMISYINGNSQIVLQQIILSTEPDWFANYNPDNSTVIEIPNFGNYITTEEDHYLVWSDDEYSYALSGNLHLEDMLRIADSLVTD